MISLAALPIDFGGFKSKKSSPVIFVTDIQDEGMYTRLSVTLSSYAKMINSFLYHHEYRLDRVSNADFKIKTVMIVIAPSEDWTIDKTDKDIFEMELRMEGVVHIIYVRPKGSEWYISKWHKQSAINSSSLDPQKYPEVTEQILNIVKSVKGEA